MKILLVQQKTLEEKKNFFRSALFHMKTIVSLRYLVNDCSCPWFPKGLLNKSFYHHSQLWYVICLSETFLDSTVSQYDENIIINGYSLLWADHHINKKRGGVCLYFKQHLPLIRRNDPSILQEYLVTEIIVDNEKYCFTCLYRSPNQIHEELENFSSNLDLLLSNINDNHPTCFYSYGRF